MIISTWSLTFRLTNYVIKADDVKLNTKQRHCRLHKAVLMQTNRLKFGLKVFLSS